MKVLQTLMIAAAVFSGTPAMAHDDATLDKMAAPHGGQLRMAGVYHFELVVAKDSKEVKDNPVLVYLTDHADKKVPSAGTRGTVTILAGKEKTTVQLLPDGDNKLKGSGRYASDPAMKAIVSITFADGKTEQTRHEPLKNAPAPADPHAGHKH